MVNLTVRQVVNGFIVTVYQKMDIESLWDTVQHVAGLLADPATLLKSIPGIAQSFNPVSEYVFDSLMAVGEFVAALDESDEPMVFGNNHSDRLVPEPPSPHPDVLTAPGTVESDIEDFVANLIMEWPEGGLENGDDVEVPDGLTVRLEDGHSYIPISANFCGLYKKNPDTAVLRVTLAEGVERVIRVNRLSLQPLTPEE